MFAIHMQIVLFVIMIFIIIVPVIIIIMCYRKCPYDKLMVVSGSVGGGRSCIVRHGGTVFVWPIIQKCSYLDLTPFSIDIELKGAPSKQNIRVDVPASFTVGISTQESIMQNAAERLLDLSRNDVVNLAQEIILGQLRRVIATMYIEELNTQRDRFMAAVQENVDQELEKLGLRLMSCDIKTIREESGLFASFAKEALSAITADTVVFNLTGLGKEAQKNLFRELIGKNPELLDEFERPRTGDENTNQTAASANNSETSSLDVAAIAGKLKSRGMMSSDIAEITGLSELEIMGLK